MPSDLLVVSLSTLPILEPGFATRRIRRGDRDDLALAYKDSYPPEAGAADLGEAEAEIDASFAGQFGVLRYDASYVTEHDGHAVGAILVTERSIWDHNVPGPFVIDLFLSPVARGCGAGRALVQAAMHACRCSGDQTLTLRVGKGTSPAALGIYRSLGFIDYLEIPTSERDVSAGDPAPAVGQQDGR